MYGDPSKQVYDERSTHYLTPVYLLTTVHDTVVTVHDTVVLCMCFWLTLGYKIAAIKSQLIAIIDCWSQLIAIIDWTSWAITIN